MASWIEIGGQRIGQGYPVYIVAELSANHGQSYEQAVKLVEAAKHAGADAIKFQTYTPDTLTIDSDRDPFRIRGDNLWSGQTLYQLYSKAYMPWEWQPKLQQLADQLGLDCFSTPFDVTAIDFLAKMDVPAYKIASFETGDLQLLRAVAETRKPIIMSTGMATLEEIDESVRTIRRAGANQIALLKCTSAYPAQANVMNLRTIPHMAEAFSVAVGLSDHTLDIAVPIAAVAVGACIIEKHFTLSRAMGGPDSPFSLEPNEFKEMVQAVRIAESSLGNVCYGISDDETSSRLFRRSLFVVRDVKSGEMFTTDNVRSIRPGDGLHTRYWDNIIGNHASQDIARGTPLSWDMVVHTGKYRA